MVRRSLSRSLNKVGKWFKLSTQFRPLQRKYQVIGENNTGLLVLGFPELG